MILAMYLLFDADMELYKKKLIKLSTFLHFKTFMKPYYSSYDQNERVSRY